jgi:predicted outer membrane repeat protein
MKKIFLIAVLFYVEGVRANTTISTDQNDTGEIGIVYGGENFTIEDGVAISNFTNTKGNKGGYLSLDATAGTVAIGDGVSFINNAAYSGGGAIKAQSGFTMGANALFDGNSVSDGWSAGGAVYVKTAAGQTVSFGDGAVFRNNHVESAASNMGGAIDMDEDNAGDVVIGNNAKFLNNSAGAGLGGAISNFGAAGSLTIGSGATFSGNTAAAGGAIMNAGILTIGAASFTTASDSIYLSDGLTTVVGNITSKSSLTMTGGALNIGNSKLVFEGDVKILGGSTLTILINSNSDYGSISAGRLVVAESDPDSPVAPMSLAAPNLRLIVANGANITGKLNIFNSQNSSVNFDAVDITDPGLTPLAMGNPLYNFYAAGDGGVYVARAATMQSLASSLIGAPYVAYAAGGWENLSNPAGYAAMMQNNINTLAQTDGRAFARAMETLAHNNSALLLFAGFHHVGAAFSGLGGAPAGASMHCKNDYGACVPEARSPVEIWGRYAGGSADFKSDMNGGFDADFNGFAAGANIRVSPDSIIGLAIDHTNTSVAVTDISTKGDANSFSVFSKNRSGAFFFNAAANMGWIDWDESKEVAGLGVDADIRSRFFAGEIDGGMALGFASPRVALRYARVMTDEYSDAAMQTFGAWDADALTAIAGVNLGRRIDAGDFYLTPALNLSYSRDVYRGGDKNIDVSIGQAAGYGMPVEFPDRDGVSVSAGLWISSKGGLRFGIDYQKEWRGDYDAESFRVAMTTGF